MPTEDLAFRLRADGGPESARAIELVAQAIQKLTATSKANDAATDAVSRKVHVADEQTKQWHRSTATLTGALATSNAKLNTFGSTLGMAGQAFGRLNPAAGQMVSTLGQATGSIQTLLSAGLGPMGVALGVATTAFGIISAAVVGFKEDQVDLVRVIQDQTLPGINDVISAMQRARNTAALRTRIDSGLGTGIEQEAGRRETRGELEHVTSQINAIIARQNTTDNYLDQRESGQLRALEEQRHNLQVEFERRTRLVESGNENDRLISQNAAALAAIDAAADEARGNGTLKDRPSGGRGARTREGISLQQEAVNLTNKENAASELELSLLRQEEEARARIADKIQTQLAALDALNAEKAAGNKIAETLRREEEDARAASLAEELGNKNKERANEADLRAAERAKEVQESWNQTIASGEDSLKSFGAAAGSAFQEALASGGNLASAFTGFIDKKLEALAIDETVQGIGSLALAVGNTIFNPPLAASKYAEAGLHFAAAAAAGGISAAIPNAPAGGGGAGAGGESRPQKSGTSSGSGDTTVIVNFGGEVVTAATEAELGRRIGRMVESGRTRLGRG